AIIEINRLGTKLLCQVQPVLDVVDHKYSARAFELCRVSGHQAHGSGTVDGHGFANFHAGEFGGVVAGWENVCEHGQVFFMCLALGQLHAVVVRKWYAKQFCLATGVWAHAHVTVGATGGARFVDGQAECGFPGATVVTEATGNVEGQDHTVTLFDGCHTGADFFHNAHVFVSEGDPGLGVRSAFIHVQIRAANSGGSYPNDDVAGVLNFWILNIFNGNFVRSFIYNSFHTSFSLLIGEKSSVDC